MKKGVYETTSQAVAIKLLPFDIEESESQKKKFFMRQNLNHPGLISLINYIGNLYYVKRDGRVQEKTAIIMELAGKGNLFEYVKYHSTNFGRGFSEDLARVYFIQLIETIKYCHQQGIAHVNMKPENLLLDDEYNLKIADFGWRAIDSPLYR